nr:hypothetical protein CFP56_54939 [Quercus suber]
MLQQMHGPRLRPEARIPRNRCPGRERHKALPIIIIMAAELEQAPHINGTGPANKPVQLSIGLPRSPGTRIYLHLTVLATSIVLFVTSAGIEAGQAGAAMGSFVYAMPDVSVRTLSGTSMDFTTRLSRLLVRRTRKLCYVGGSISLSEAAGGGTVEEEMEAFRAIVDVVVTEVAKVTASSADEP